MVRMKPRLSWTVKCGLPCAGGYRRHGYTDGAPQPAVLGVTGLELKGLSLEGLFAVAINDTGNSRLGRVDLSAPQPAARCVMGEGWPGLWLYNHL